MCLTAANIKNSKTTNSKFKRKRTSDGFIETRRAINSLSNIKTILQKEYFF